MQTLLIPSVPIDILRVIQKLSSAFQEMMIEIVRSRSSKSMSISRIAEGFFRKCGVSCPGWPLCDVIFIRFFEKVAKSYLVGKAFILYASCFIVCLCLNDLNGIIHLIIDLYVGSDKTKVTLEKCKSIFTTILLNSSVTAVEHLQEINSKFVEYITARNQLHGVPLMKPYEDSDEIPTAHLKHFLCQTHPSLIWPVNMMHKQLQKFLYGAKFWEKSRSQHFFTFLAEKGIVSDCFLFVDVLFKIHSASASKVNLDEIWNQHWSPDLGPTSTTFAYDIFLATHSKSGKNRLDKRFDEEKHSHPERIPSPLNIGMKDQGNLSDEEGGSDSENEDGDETVTGKRVRISRSVSPYLANYANIAANGPPPPFCSAMPSPLSPLSPRPLPHPHTHSTPSGSGFPPSPSTSTFSSVSPTKNLKDIRVLVIEDSIFQRKLIVRGLMKCMGEELTDYEDKWPVVSAGNGEEAFKLLESQRYDIFIVDENLDGTGGILKGHEVVTQLRKIPNLQDTIIIGCTSNVKSHQDAFLAAGANTVWSKPIPSPAILQEDLKNLLNQRRIPTSLPSSSSSSLSNEMEGRR